MAARAAADAGTGRVGSGAHCRQCRHRSRRVGVRAAGNAGTAQLGGVQAVVMPAPRSSGGVQAVVMPAPRSSGRASRRHAGTARVGAARRRMNAALRPCVAGRARVGAACRGMNAALHPCVDEAYPRVGGQDAGMPRCETPDARATRHARCSTPGHAQGTHSVDRRRLPCDRQRRDRRGAAASHGDVAARALWHGRRSDGDRSIDPAARHRPCSVNDDAGPIHEPTHGRSRRSNSSSRTGITPQRCPVQGRACLRRRDCACRRRGPSGKLGQGRRIWSRSSCPWGSPRRPCTGSRNSGTRAPSGQQIQSSGCR